MVGLISARKTPAWVPLVDELGTEALIDLDFETGNFRFNSITYANIAAVITAIGAGADNADGTYTLGPVSNIPFAGYNTAAGTVVCDFTCTSVSLSSFAWTIQKAADATNYWRCFAQDNLGNHRTDVLRAGTNQANLIDNSAPPLGVRQRSVEVIASNDFTSHINGELIGQATSGSVPATVTLLTAYLGHRTGTNKLPGSVNRWAYFPRAISEERRSILSSRINEKIVGAQTYFVGSRGIVINGETWTGYVTRLGNIAHRRNQGGSITLHARLQGDDHDNPSYLRRSFDGRIIEHHAKHSADNNYYQRISTNPDDMTSWGTLTNINAANALAMTVTAYSCLIEITDGIFAFFRAIATGQAYYTWGYIKSTDNGATWTTFQQLWAEPGMRSYSQFYKVGANQIACICNDGHPDEYTVDRNSTYYALYDAGTFKKADGTALGSPPFRPSTTLEKIWNATTQLRSSWVADVKPGPVCVFATFGASPNHATDHRAVYAKWNGLSWDVNQICTTGGTRYPVGDSTQDYYFGGMCIDPDDVNTVYVSRETGTGGPHRNSGWFQIWKAVTADGGANWTLTQLTFGNVDCYHPRKEDKGFDGTLSRLAYQRGPFTSYLSYATEMVLL